MSALKWIAACAVLTVSVTALASNVQGIVISHHEALQHLRVQSRGEDFSQKLQPAAPISVRFDALGRTFELELDPNVGLFAAASRSAEAGALIPYRGRIAGISRSWARIVMLDGTPAGMVWDGEDLFAIEVPGDSIVDTSTPIIYRLADAIIAPGALSCASASSATNGAAMYKSLVGNLSVAMAQGAGAVSEINLGAIGDSDFTNIHGSNTAAAIITRLNNVDGIYSEQIGVQINVPLVETFTDVTDPFTAVTDPGTLLEEVAAYRLATPGQQDQGLTHLYTGRDLDGTTVGIAYMEALCRSRFGAGLSQGGTNATFDSLVTAHEIGHNFGAPHDAVTGSPCEAEPATFIMATSLNSGNDQFSACSIMEMQDDIAAASCITPLPSTDASIAFNDQPPTILLGNAATITFDVANNGTTQAINVVTDVTLPNNVSFLSAAGSTGSCTNGAGTVSCQLGDIPGSSAATVTVTTATTGVGIGVFDASVTADADDNGSNNQTSAQLTVDPAVNLIVNIPSSAQVTVNQSTNVSATLQNQSILDATGVTLSISLDSGLRANSASWSIGTCSVTAQQIDCQAGQFDAQSNSTLDLNVTGLTTGTKNYTVALASAEADADPSNNSVDASVTVNSASGGGNNSDGGGGAFGVMFLWLLACATALLECRKPRCELRFVERPVRY